MSYVKSSLADIQASGHLEKPVLDCLVAKFQAGKTCSGSHGVDDLKSACSGVLQSAEAADRAAELQQVDVEDGLEEPYVPSGTKLIEDYSQDQFRKISIY